MNCKYVFTLTLTVSLPFASFFATAVRADEDAVQTVIDLISDKDKEVRAIGLEQVRDEAKGTEATRRFAAALPKLAADAQVGLLGALAGRGDAAAKPAVIDMLKDSQGEVRAAAIRALGSLGDAGDVPRLVALLAETKSQNDAVDALARLKGSGVNAALCGQWKAVAAPVRVALREAARRPSRDRMRARVVDGFQGQGRQGPRCRFGGAGQDGRSRSDRQAGPRNPRCQGRRLPHGGGNIAGHNCPA